MNSDEEDDVERLRRVRREMFAEFGGLDGYWQKMGEWERQHPEQMAKLKPVVRFSGKDGVATRRKKTRPAAKTTASRSKASRKH